MSFAILVSGWPGPGHDRWPVDGNPADPDRAARVRRSTLDNTYRSKVRLHIIPAWAPPAGPADPEHVERFYTRLSTTGLRPRPCCKSTESCPGAQVAVQRGHLTRNVAPLVDAPSATPAQIEPLTLAEAKAPRPRQRGCAQHRWSVALALGLRQGEALGLRWADGT
jgi:integrase